MSDLGANDLVLMLNKRVVRNLAISLDHMFERTVGRGVLLLDLAAAIDPTLNTWVNRGLEHPTEVETNPRLAVPRLLYATTNPTFSPVPPGANDRETLLNRLRRYDDEAPGPVVATLPAQAQIHGVPLNNPCPIQFKQDPGRRFTFLRDGFYRNNASSFLDVTANGLEMTISGTAYRGNLFSRHRAMYGYTHTFEMKLLYKLQFINDSDINIDDVPFKMVADPPAPTYPDLPSLPAKGSFVFARDFEERRFVLPTLVPDPDIPQLLIQPPGLDEQLFRGRLDDLIYENEWMSPRYRVEPKSDDEPESLVIVDLADPNHAIVAEAEGGRMALAFDSMVSLEMQPDNVSPAEKALIGTSLCKIHPTLSQAFLCAAGQDGAPVNLSLLSLLGPESLDIPIMPRTVVVPTEAEIIKQNSNKPGPLNSVWSNVLTCDLTTDKYFPQPQALAVAGKIGGSGQQNFNDFSVGADLSIGVSQAFIQHRLNAAAEEAKAKILKDPPEGLDASSLQATGSIDTDAIVIDANGSGEIETPFFMPNIGYDFWAHISARLRTRRVLNRQGDRAVDRFGCPIVSIPPSSSGWPPGRNPLCYLTYFDPHQGIACFDDCPVSVRVPPPVLDKDGNEILIADPDNPPNICEDPNTPEQEQHADDHRCFGIASFQLSENSGLKHEWELEPRPPEDDDIQVGVNINWGALFLGGLLGVLGLLLGAPLTFFATGFVITGVLTAPLSDLIAEAVVHGEIEDRVSKQNLETLDPSLVGTTPLLGMHLENPDVRPPYALQPGAFIVRFNVVIEPEGLNVAA